MIANLPEIICVLLIIFSIKDSIKGSLERESAKYSLNRLVYYFSIFMTFLFMNLNLGKIHSLILQFISHDQKLIALNNNLFKAIVLGILFLLIQSIIYLILKNLNKPLIKIYNAFLYKNNITIIILSTIFGFAKGSIIILTMFMGIIEYNSTLGKEMEITIFNDIKGYSKIESILRVNENNIISLEKNNNEIKEYVPSKSDVRVYYNGVTLDEGIRSTDEIDKKAREIVYGAKTDREKAKRLYVWIGSNISYDFDKAKKVLSSEGEVKSGAISAWESKSGICFDYVCLYVAMSKAVGLGSRIITGEAYDGENYIPHAWNQAYLKDEGIWINVDPTFYRSGDYFDNSDFYTDHLKPEIAGEWD